MRRLIVNADDFGRADAIDDGVAFAHRRGIVTSASLMVRWRPAERAAAIARSLPRLGLGLHVDLLEVERVGDGWRTRYEVVPLDDARAVARELERQLRRFRSLVGRDPGHLDSHHSVHLREPAATALAEAAGRLGIPLRRVTPGTRVEQSFYGRDKAFQPVPEQVSASRLVALIDALGPGRTELLCHPALGVVRGLGYEEERVLELGALCDAAVRRAVVERGIVLDRHDDG